jgi:hypothetical protein
MRVLTAAAFLVLTAARTVVHSWPELIDSLNRADSTNNSVSLFLSNDFAGAEIRHQEYVAHITKPYCTPNQTVCAPVPSISFTQLKEVTISAGNLSTNAQPIQLDIDLHNRFFNVTHGGTLRLVGPLVLTNGEAKSKTKFQTAMNGGAGLVENGMLIATDVTFKANYGKGSGAVHIGGRGRAKLNRCIFTINQAINAGGAISISSYEDGVYVSPPDCPTDSPACKALEISGCVFKKNFAPGAGGGAIDIDNRTIDINNSKFEHNYAKTNGAAINIYGGASGSIKHCNFTENHGIAPESNGGAIASADGTLTIEATDFSGNKASTSINNPFQGDAIIAQHGEAITFVDCHKLRMPDMLVTTGNGPAVTLDNCLNQDCCAQLVPPPSPPPPSPLPDPKKPLRASKIWMPVAIVSGCVLVLISGLVLLSRGKRQAGSQGKRDFCAASATGSYSIAISEDDCVPNPWEIEYTKLVLRKRIGGGTYGTVFQGMYGKDAVAIKRLTLSPDPEDEDEGQNVKNVMSEAQLLWDLRHPRYAVCM